MEDGRFVQVDDTHWPLVHFVYPSQLHDDMDAVIRDFEKKLTEVHQRNPGPYLSLVDARRTRWAVGAGVRKRLAEMLNRVSRDYSRPLADAVVVNSELMRFMAMGVTFLQGDKRWPRRIFTDLDTAQDWLSEHAVQAGTDFVRLERRSA